MRSFFVNLIILAALVAGVVLTIADGEAMRKCRERYSLDTCHYALNR